MSASPPPCLAATIISLDNLVKSLPLLASVAAFLCFIVDHFECPDILSEHLSILSYVVRVSKLLWTARSPNIVDSTISN